MFGPDVALLASVTSKHMRREDGVVGARRLCRAFRAHNFRELVALGYDRSSARGMMEWAAALLAHNLLLRGGEIGCVVPGGFEGSRCITWASFQWMQPCAESAGCLWFFVDIVSCKDPTARHRAVPMAVRRRSAGPTAPRRL